MTIRLTLATLLLTSLLTIFHPGAGRAEETFDLFLAPTIDERLDSWLKMPPQLQPTIHLVERIYPDQPFALRVLFRGYALSPAKNAHLTYDVQVFGPDGQPTTDRGSNLLGYNGSIKGDNYIIINQQLLRIYFDRTYPFGDYALQVTATDHVTNKVASKSAKVTFAPFTREGRFASLDFFSFWLRNHFRQPDLAKATFGVLQFMEKDANWLQENIRILSFMNRLLDDNPWLWDHLAEIYRNEPESRDSIITLMALNRHQDPELSAGFNAAQKQWFAKCDKFPLPADEDKISTSAALDAQWGVFYATGYLAPVEKIVRLLKPFALSGQPPEPTPSDSLEQAAFWSLVDHGNDAPLVASYCAYLLDHGNLAPENKAQLHVILELIEKSREEQQQPPTDKKNPPSLER